MRTTKITVLLVGMFIVAMAAGIVTGRLTARQPPQRPTVLGTSPLSEELQLTQAQCDQIRPIWETTRETARACAKEAEQIQREHDEALKALLPEEQKAQYERLSQENHRRIAEQNAKRKEAFRQAVNRTETLLQPDQQRAYRQILKNQLGAALGSGEGTMAP